MCKEAGVYQSLTIVNRAYCLTMPSAPLRDFLMKLFTQLPKRILIQDSSLANVSGHFLTDLLKAEFKAGAKVPSEWDLEEVQREICPDFHLKPHSWRRLHY